MTLLTSSSPGTNTGMFQQTQHIHLANTASVPRMVPTACPMSLNETLTTRTSLCAKPFDRWRPMGGGAEKDIFRRFKILPTEEEAFLTHWARKQITSGVFERDDGGALVFRISSASMSDLNILDIARSDFPEPETQWLHVYDEEGVSWLTQFRCIDIKHFPQKIYDASGRQILANGMKGRYGPSGLTVRDFWNQGRGESQEETADTLHSHERYKANCL